MGRTQLQLQIQLHLYLMGLKYVTKKKEGKKTNSNSRYYTLPIYLAEISAFKSHFLYWYFKISFKKNQKTPTKPKPKTIICELDLSKNIKKMT